MIEAETFRVVVLFAPGDRLAVDIDPDIIAGESAAAEIVVAQPVRPAAATRTDVEDVRVRVGQPLREHEHPEVARVREEVDLIVHDAIAYPDAHAQVIGG